MTKIQSNCQLLNGQPIVVIIDVNEFPNFTRMTEGRKQIRFVRCLSIIALNLSDAIYSHGLLLTISESCPGNLCYDW